MAILLLLFLSAVDAVDVVDVDIVGVRFHNNTCFLIFVTLGRTIILRII